jgi:putative endonuclease
LGNAGGSSQGRRRIVTAAPVRRRNGSAYGAPMSSDLRHVLGTSGEQFAAEHLERLGYELLARNYRTRYGEIDLIAFDASTLVFCEVKTRRAGSGTPWEALHPRKRARVRRMACAWLVAEQDRPRSRELRFDAIGVVIDAHGRLCRLDHIEDAF